MNCIFFASILMAEVSGMGVGNSENAGMSEKEPNLRAQSILSSEQIWGVGTKGRRNKRIKYSPSH